MTPAQIKALKDDSGLSWQRFAAKIGVSARTVRYWCDPDKPKQPGRLALKALEQFAKEGEAMTPLPTKTNRLDETRYPVFACHRDEWQPDMKPDGYRRDKYDAAKVIRDTLGDPDIDATCVEWASDLGAYFAAE